MLFVSEFLIGVEIGSLHTTILRGWKGILFCLIAASATSFLMVISAAFLKMVRAKCILRKGWSLQERPDSTYWTGAGTDWNWAVKAQAVSGRNGECPVKKIGRGREEGCLSEVRQRHIYIAIRECHENQGFPIEAACELRHVARSAYYKWASGKLNHRAAENERLADKT